MAQAGTYFPKVRRMLLFLAPLNLIHFWPASTLLHGGHLALATLSLPETDIQILEHWVTLMRFTWADHSEQRILVVWRYTALVNRTHRIGFRMFELFRKIDEDFGGSIS